MDQPTSRSRRAGGNLPDLSKLANEMLAMEEAIVEAEHDVKAAQETLVRTQAKWHTAREHFELAIQAFGYKPVVRDSTKSPRAQT